MNLQVEEEFDSSSRRRTGIEPDRLVRYIFPGRRIFLADDEEGTGQRFDSTKVGPGELEPSTSGLLLSDGPITLSARGGKDESVQPAGVEPARFDVVVTGDPIDMVSSKRGVSLSMAEVEVEFLGAPLILSVTAIVPAEESKGQVVFDLAEVN